jgi:hypothetical protein
MLHRSADPFFHPVRRAVSSEQGSDLALTNKTMHDASTWIGNDPDWPQDEYESYVMPVYSILRTQKGDAPCVSISHTSIKAFWDSP